MLWPFFGRVGSPDRVTPVVGSTRGQFMPMSSYVRRDVCKAG